MIICVVNNKGGVGKTTASINMSSALTMSGNKVLLIDMDAQAHATYGVGVEPDINRKSIGDVLLSGSESRFIFYYQRNIRDVIIPTPRKDLFLIPSNKNLINVLGPLYKANRFFKSKRYNMLLQSVQTVINDYDFIVIDCPPGLNVITLNAIKACDALLIPCEASSSSIYGLKVLLEKAAELKGGDFDNYNILYSMVDLRCKASLGFAEDKLAEYGKKILKTRIKRSDQFNQCQIQMQDIFAFAPKSEGAKSYMKLTQELKKVWGRRGG